jgi:hypothetical protein
MDNEIFFTEKHIKRTLTFHYALIDQLRNRKQNMRAKLSGITVGAILRKYKFRTRTHREFGVYVGRVVKSNNVVFYLKANIKGLAVSERYYL